MQQESVRRGEHKKTGKKNKQHHGRTSTHKHNSSDPQVATRNRFVSPSPEFFQVFVIDEPKINLSEVPMPLKQHAIEFSSSISVYNPDLKDKINKHTYFYTGQTKHQINHPRVFIHNNQISIIQYSSPSLIITLGRNRKPSKQNQNDKKGSKDDNKDQNNDEEDNYNKDNNSKDNNNKDEDNKQNNRKNEKDDNGDGDEEKNGEKESRIVSLINSQKFKDKLQRSKILASIQNNRVMRISERKLQEEMEI
ncbi:MAG: hypothetical protein EZS28_007173 [Streblomastix strix]|uniref:Uncharacterized protein n=1 Tax=Streblomastix strix TaxID=222440 RepID=A0A5J4WT59_9EUKA|nr:MAG: hypothetical protein EZS28_007173 [Streblomastix strix]